MAASLFISHASNDAKVAEQLCQALEGRGFECWLASRDVAPGENFQAAIVRAIRGSRMLLLVFTGAANNSDEVAKELALASQSKVSVVPLKVEDVPPSEALAYEFATRQWIDFHTDWARAVEQLVRHLSGALAVEASAPPPPSPAVVGSAPELGPAPRPGRPRDRDRRRDRDVDRAGAMGEAAAAAAIAQAMRRRAARRPARSPMSSVRTVLLVIGLVILFVVLLPWLKRITAPPAAVNAPAAASPPAPANPSPNNSEVPF